VGFGLFRVGLHSTFVVTAILVLLDYATATISAPMRVGVIFWALSLIFVVGGRFLARSLLTRRNLGREPVIIYGAGDAGAKLLADLFGGDDYLPVALVDDDESLQGKRVQGLQVESPDRISRIALLTGAKSLLLAIPSASRRMRRKVLERVSEHPIRVQTIPDTKDIISGKARVDDLRDVSVNDLLGRDSVPPNPRLLSAAITNKNVAVTGAGGSIGSELCRQVLRQRPRRLVLFEISEPGLYEIERRLRKLMQTHDIECELVGLLGSVNNQRRIHEVLSNFKVQTVYHAAAYKHVPIVEQNLFEGIYNNVIGTWSTVRAAIDAGVELFVLISTDKAVNPTSVMGATKRMAELVLQAYQTRDHRMCLSMVRFGNVLESSGSVVPLFREQIRQGGPVTVTHRDIVRYFMTIPEAAQLVIQAGAMAKGGDVFVLDMGDPVKIDDLAHRMISLMGLTVRSPANPDGDIEIRYTGLRPAEKLYEELLIGSNVTGTDHPRIMRADEDSLDFGTLSSLVEELRGAADALDHEKARATLIRAVREYSPENGVDDLVWVQKTGTEPRARSNSIVDFPVKPQ
jgi:FlaA1/EpsC-like NDP-sugar epimerase